MHNEQIFFFPICIATNRHLKFPEFYLVRICFTVHRKKQVIFKTAILFPTENATRSVELKRQIRHISAPVLCKKDNGHGQHAHGKSDKVDKLTPFEFVCFTVYGFFNVLPFFYRYLRFIGQQDFLSRFFGIRLNKRIGHILPYYVQRFL